MDLNKRFNEMEKFGFNTLLNSMYMKILEYFLPE